MDLTRLLRLMPEEERKQIQKVIDILKIGGRSKKKKNNNSTMQNINWNNCK